ncbi:MAG: homoserine dehydrogenase [candidate division Zixibacteria bacterium]|nr:homoserine dehydrogenase [candidate division Zixibacteria bacterium]
MKTLHLFQYGKGNIGAALFRQIAAQKKTLEKRYGFRFEYVGLCGRDRAVLAPSGFDGAIHTDSPERILAEHPDRRPYTDAMDILTRVLQLDLPDLCIVDTTAADFADVHLTCLRHGATVVTANKKPLAAPYPVYEEMQRLGREACQRYWYETTAGAGLPVIGTIRELIATGDVVSEITGCLSGTLGYICSQLDTGRAFSAIVEEARTLGYTEPDPRDDLNGMDVARKALILAREIGYRVELADIKTTGMVSDTLLAASSVEAFMECLEEEDAVYARRVEDCRGRAETLRYVATIHDGDVRVGLENTPKDSPTGSLSGPDNLIAITTPRYAARPVVIRGPGAGAEVTAGGLFGDLIKAAMMR